MINLLGIMRLSDSKTICKNHESKYQLIPIWTGIGGHHNSILHFIGPRSRISKYRLISSKYRTELKYRPLFWKCQPAILFLKASFFPHLIHFLLSKHKHSKEVPPTTLSIKSQPSHKILMDFFATKPNNSTKTLIRKHFLGHFLKKKSQF